MLGSSLQASGSLGEAQVGSTIRSYDLQKDDEFFIQGVITEITTKSPGHQSIHFEVTIDCSMTQPWERMSEMYTIEATGDFMATWGADRVILIEQSAPLVLQNKFFEVEQNVSSQSIFTPKVHLKYGDLREWLDNVFIVPNEEPELITQFDNLVYFCDRRSGASLSGTARIINKGTIAHLRGDEKVTEHLLTHLFNNLHKLIYTAS